MYPRECMLQTDSGNHMMFSIIYMIYIMILNLPTNKISLLRIIIQKHLLKNFPLQHYEMNIYTMRFLKIHET